MIGALTAVAALFVFITAHEAGHYFAAKATGMKVTEFFLGFGPRIWSFKKGETEYGIKPIPLGAYVKVVGMSALEEVAPEDEGRTYRERPFWKKSVVVLAGVGANFLIAFIMLGGIALAEGRPVLVNGEPVPSTTVGAVVDEVDGRPTAAALAGLQRGDRIVAIDGRPIGDWVEMVATLEGRAGERLTLTVERQSEILELETVLGSRPHPDTGEPVGFLGMAPRLSTESISVFEAGAIAGRQVVDGIGLTFVSFGRLLQLDTLGQVVGAIGGGEIDDEVRPVSVIGVVQIGAQATQIGWINFVFLLAIVNVILGTLNALPLYPLDGGHFAVALYEKLSGRRADVRKLIPVAVMVIGIISVIGLMAIILDIVDPIEL